MKEFKTLGPTQFGVGDGVKTRFSVARPGDIVRDSNIESVRRVGWQGDQLLHPYPRTNLAIASNDFTNSAWQGSPSLYMDFLSGTMPSSVDFSRASTATYVGRDRLIHTAAINEPRFTYDPTTGQPEGLLVEGQATNLLLWSEDFTKGDWIGQSNWTSDGQNSPVIGVNYQRFVAPTDGDTNSVLQLISGGTGRLSISVFVGDQTDIAGIMFNIDDNEGNSSRATVGLSSGEIETTNGNGNPELNVKKLPGGQRLSVTFDRYDTAQNRVGIIFKNNLSSNSYSSDILTGQVVEMIGLMVEQASTPTSYIPTEGSQVTRASDGVIIPTGDWFNPNEGTFVVEFVAPEPTGFNTLIGMGSANAEEFRLGYGIQSTTRFAVTARAGATQTSTPTVTIQPGQRYKAAASYRPTSNGIEWKLSVSGDVIGTAETERLPDGFVDTGVAVGRRRPNSNALNWNGTASSIAYYPRALSNAELEALTS